MLGFSPLAGAPLASAGDANTRTLILAATDAQDTVAIILDGSAALYLAATEAQDVAVFDVAALTLAALAATEASDAASVVIYNTEIVLAAAEAIDTAAVVIEINGSLVMAATETPDSYSQNAYILWLEPTEPDDPSIWVPKNDPAPYLTTVI